MAKNIVDKAVERFILNAVGSLGRTAGHKITELVKMVSEKKKADRRKIKDDLLENKDR